MGLVHRLRFFIGRHLYYIGYRIQPPSYRRGLACLSALGVAWAKNNEDDLLRVMRGEMVIEWHWTGARSSDDMPSPPEGKI